MGKLDWNLALQRNIVMLKFVGLWPEGIEYHRNLYTIYAITLIFIFVCTYNFFQCLNIVFGLDDVEALTANIIVPSTHILAILKSYYLIRNMQTLKNLMTTLNSDIFQPRNIKQRDLAEISIDFWKTIYTIFSTMAASSLVFYAASPLVDSSAQERRLPFPSWYPYDYKISPFYELTYIYQIASVFITCTIILNTDTLIAALNMCVGVQCDLLCDNLRHIHTFYDVNDQLMSCVKHHQIIVQFAANSNQLYNGIALVQYFISGVSFAMIVFQITVIHPFSSEFCSLCFYGVSVLVQIFMYCWFGNEVEVKSSKIPYAAFESDWIGPSLKMQENMVFMILRSQRPIKVSAFNLFYLSLDTFVKILRTSWSYFAILCQVNE